MTEILEEKRDMDKKIINSKIMCIEERSSNIELFRIVTMLIIVAHHYVVNSGLLTIVGTQSILKAKDIFLLLFGLGSIRWIFLHFGLSH